MQQREESVKEARRVRIEEHRQELHDLLIKRDLIKKEVLKELEDGKITQIKSQLGA
jgi:hypothetical protein